MRLLHRQFDVLGIMVATPDDDQVFEATRYEEFAVLQKSQVSCAHEWAFCAAGQVCSESALGFCGFLPVPLGDARTRDPNLTYLIRQAWGQGFWIDNDNLLAGRCLTRTYECAQTFVFIEGFSAGWDNPVLCKRHGLECFNDWESSSLSAGNYEAGLREAIARIKRLTAEATGCKGFNKALQGFRAYRLSSINGNSPTAEIECSFLLRSNFTDAEVIGEVRSGADGSPGVRDGL